MSHDEQIRAALEAEAALAQVPAREILNRVKQSGVRVRRAYLWERPQVGRVIRAVAAVAAIGVMVSASFLGGNLVGKRSTGQADVGQTDLGPAGKATPVPEAASGPVTAYESRNLGFRIAFPSQFVGPEKDEQGALVFQSDKVSVTVERRPRPQGQVIEDVLGDLVAENFKQSRRLQPAGMGFRPVSGRDAAYLHTKYISAAGWFERDTYGVVAGQHLYVITCGGRPGEQVTWEVAQPICDQVIEKLEVGTDLGFVSRDAALAAVRTAVPGELEVTMVALDERFNVQGIGLQPVWRVHVIVTGQQQAEYDVVVDARSGKVLYVQNVATGERTTP